MTYNSVYIIILPLFPISPFIESSIIATPSEVNTNLHKGTVTQWAIFSRNCALKKCFPFHWFHFCVYCMIIAYIYTYNMITPTSLHKHMVNKFAEWIQYLYNCISKCMYAHTFRNKLLILFISNSNKWFIFCIIYTGEQFRSYVASLNFKLWISSICFRHVIEC